MTSPGIAARYASLVRDYERWWSPVIRPMAIPLIASLPLRDARLVADVGAGTGALAPDLLAAAAPGARVVALDLTEAMLRVAQTRAIPVVCDAMSLPLGRGVADAAVSVFMLQHAADPAGVVREMARLVGPGGIVATVTWGAEHDHEAEVFTDEILTAAGAPPLPTASWHAQVDSPSKMRGIFEAAGVSAVHAEETRPVHGWDRESLWMVVTNFGGAKARFASLPAASRDAALAQVASRIDAMPHGAWTWTPGVVAAWGRAV